MGTANLSRRYSGGSLMLTTHIHLVPKLGMKGAIRSLPLYTFRAWGRTLIFYFYCCCCYCCCCTVTVVFIAGSLYLKTRKNFGAMIIYIYIFSLYGISTDCLRLGFGISVSYWKPITLNLQKQRRNILRVTSIFFSLLPGKCATHIP